jgi:hypothetical protein
VIPGSVAHHSPCGTEKWYPHWDTKISYFNSEQPNDQL